ncbi:PIG-L family deacetylase [Streptomyces xanthochromogenes]|uniref:PIG-L family deacetylase n=1 Tax=Streptomyces xanthochromogenes TaxID=67384 RepID=UPI0037F44792
MPSSPSRRRLLQVAGGGLVAAPLAYGGWQWLAPRGGAGVDSPSTGTTTGKPASDSANQAYLHVIAHADDSIYFMNPDLEQSIRSGALSVTVCMTSGESDGRNAPGKSPQFKSMRTDRPGFARARINGLRAANALMATGDDNSPWTVEPVELLPGFRSELHYLQAAPHVQLIYMGLCEARYVSVPRPVSMRGLWLGAIKELPTLPGTGSPVRMPRAYTRDQIIDALAAVIARVNPTVIRTLDPTPMHAPRETVAMMSAPTILRGLSYLDHQDHTSSAQFMQAAMERYWGGGKGRPASVSNYIGYPTNYTPPSLDAAATRRNSQLLNAYGWADHRDCGDAAGCGDLKVGPNGLKGGGAGWARGTRTRTPGTVRWLAPLKDGRLAAFAVLNGAVRCWVEREAGKGPWGGPFEAVGSAGGPLDPQVEVVRLPDGTLQLFGTRTVLPFKGQKHHKELVYVLQTGVGADGVPKFGAWTSLGAPDTAPEKSLETGYPATAVAPDGTVHVLARNWAGDIAMRSGKGGKGWGPWQLLDHPAGKQPPHPLVVEGIDALVDPSGRIHVAAPTAKTVLHWVSPAPGELPRLSTPTGLPPSGSAVSLVADGKGGALAVYRGAGTAQVTIAAPGGPSGTSEAAWKVARRTPAGGYGRVSAYRLNGNGAALVIAARDEQGRVVPATDSSAKQAAWETPGVQFVGIPGMSQDSAGRAVLVVLGTDGQLYAARQTRPGARFGEWSAAAQESAGSRV